VIVRDALDLHHSKITALHLPEAATLSSPSPTVDEETFLQDSRKWLLHPCGHRGVEFGARWAKESLVVQGLGYLNNAQSLQDLRVPPGNRLEQLAGDRQCQHSIRINDQWRICFVWRDRDAYDVEIVDYH
jgi:proteic killer suppression protein